MGQTLASGGSEIGPKLTMTYEGRGWGQKFQIFRLRKLWTTPCWEKRVKKAEIKQLHLSGLQAEKYGRQYDTRAEPRQSNVFCATSLLRCIHPVRRSRDYVYTS